MHRVALVWMAALVWLAPGAAAAADPLTEARRLYNQGQYEAAEQAALEAPPAAVNAARLIIGRARLERFRQSADPADLEIAREALRAIDPVPLDSRDRVELTVGLGQAMYLEHRFGAAAELFESALDHAALLGVRSRERVLDWWATALDRHAQTREGAERPEIYRRIVEQMSKELLAQPGSTPASYWLAAAARGCGDLDRAYQAALAGWVRAPLALDHGAALRADLDRLVVQAILPDRASRLPARDVKAALEGMLAEWQTFKAAWTR